MNEPRVDVARARELRRQGMTLQAIGTEFGVSRERIRQLVGSPARTVACEGCDASFKTARLDRRFCSRSCAEETRKKRIQGRCECGAAMGPTAKACWDCSLAAREKVREERWTRIAELWADGLPVSEIARHVGRANANALGVEMARMRHAGWKLPPRRAGWKGHSRPTAPSPLPPRTPQQARQQLGDAVRNGRIRRPNRCERCGQQGYVEGHHSDYAKALYVEWLCRSCHAAHHAPLVEAAA